MEREASAERLRSGGLYRSPASSFARREVGPRSILWPPRRLLLEDGRGIRTVQELLGHADVSTTTEYFSVLNRGALGVTHSTDSGRRRSVPADSRARFARNHATRCLTRRARTHGQ